MRGSSPHSILFEELEELGLAPWATPLTEPSWHAAAPEHAFRNMQQVVQILILSAHDLCIWKNSEAALFL